MALDLSLNPLAPHRHGWVPTDDKLAERFGMKPRTKAQREAQERFDDEQQRRQPFFIKGQASASDRRSAGLWKAALAVRGEHIPTRWQFEGSCVDQGRQNAIDYVQYVEIANGQREKYYPTSIVFYGWTRYFSGSRGTGHGASGGGAAQCSLEKGSVPYLWDGEGQTGSPEPTIKKMQLGSALYTSGKIETQFSSYRNVPKTSEDFGAQHLIRSCTRIKGFRAICDAIYNGYPVTIASGQGFRGQLGLNWGEVRRGKRWGIPGGSWAHQMTFIGFDDDPADPGCYCLNSWNPDVHGKPENDEPPGGFWVPADTVERMSMDEAYPYSQFDGYPEQDTSAWALI